MKWCKTRGEQMNELSPTIEEYEEAKQTNNLDVINRVIQYGVRDERNESEESGGDSVDVGQTDTTPEDDEEVELSYSEIVELEKQRQLELEEQLGARDNEIERLKLLAAEQKKMLESRVVPQFEPVDPNEYDNEYDMLIEESRRMKDYISKLTPGTDEASRARVELQSVEQKIDSVTKTEDETKHRRAIADEFSAFWRSHKELDPGMPFHTVQDTYATVCENVQQVFGVSEAEANIRLANLFDKRSEKKTRELFEKNGVSIPENFDKIYESARVYDYMNGKALNTSTGQYRDVMNRMGKVQTLADMETAYRLMNDKKLTLKKEREIFQKAQEFYNRANKNGAREIPREALSNIREEDTKNVSYLRSIISDALRNPLKYKTDKNLERELKLAQQTIANM
jgi:hypothetical protein